MKAELVDLLVCPACQVGFQLVVDSGSGDHIEAGHLDCPQCNRRVPIQGGVPRFVDSDKYVSSFSFQRNLVRKYWDRGFAADPTTVSAFELKTGVPAGELKGKTVLDVGCGYGRFLGVVSDAGGRIVGVDLSTDSVELCQDKFGGRAGVDVIQADVLDLPFPKGADAAPVFDLIFSIGVLDHTPDCERSFKSLPPLLKDDGRISIWIYDDYDWIRNRFSDIYRKVTTRLPSRMLLGLCHWNQVWTPIRRIPRLGRLFNEFLPGCHTRAPWAIRVMSDFDWYSPTFQSKHTFPQVFRWFEEAGLEKIRIYDPPVSVTGCKGK